MLPFHTCTYNCVCILNGLFIISVYFSIVLVFSNLSGYVHVLIVLICNQYMWAESCSVFMFHLLQTLSSQYNQWCNIPLWWYYNWFCRYVCCWTTHVWHRWATIEKCFGKWPNKLTLIQCDTMCLFILHYQRPCMNNVLYARTENFEWK